MRRPPSVKTERGGVTATQQAVQDKLKWIFREQFVEDFGIDAQIEVVDGEMVEGRLLAVQIKSGESYFNESGPGGWWFRPDDDHVRYWMNHSLPVVVVLHHPATKKCHWQLVKESTLTGTSTGGWKILVPEDNVLDESAEAPLRAAAEADPYVLRIRELQLARPWMELLGSGQRLVIDIEEWIHKSSGRGSISLGVDNEDGGSPTPLATWGVYLGSSDYAEVVPTLFAWADVSVYEETYDDADHEEYEAECVTVDSEGDRFESQDFAEWAAGHQREELRPYTNVAGEADLWRLELTLNDLGRSFLIVDRFANLGLRQLTR